MQIETIDPTSDPSWEEFLLRQPNATLFHSTAWARVLRDTYGFEPTYLVARGSDGDINAGMAMMKVGGRRVSLPFSDFCAPLFLDHDAGAALIEAARSWLQNGTSCLELRGDASVDLTSWGFQRTTPYVRHIVPLDGDPRKRCRRSLLKSARKAERAGVTCRVSTSKEDLQRFFRLQVMTRKKHGLLPQPYRFFDNIYRHYIEEGAGHLLLAEREGRLLAGGVLLAFKDTMYGKATASDPRYLHLRANHLLIPEKLEFAVSLGCRQFDLGRSDVDGAGLRSFKNDCGGVEEPLSYYYDPCEPPSVAALTGASLKRRLLAFAVRFAPMWALRQAGAVLYKYAA